MTELSIVIPTLQRAELLERCLYSVERGTQCSFEIVVVDGASTDDTGAVLNRARQRLGDRLQIIREEQREGFTKAVNKGFRASTGRFMMWLNDDARPNIGSLDQALQQMASANAKVGLVALFHAWHGTRSVAYETRISGQVYRLLHARGTLYANFGLGRRETFANLNYFDEAYYMNGCDPDFSMKVWHAGMRVEPAYLTAIDHDELNDANHQADSAKAGADIDRLFAKWDLPGKNVSRNEFDPANPCTLRGRRDQAAVAI